MVEDSYAAIAGGYQGDGDEALTVRGRKEGEGEREKGEGEGEGEYNSVAFSELYESLLAQCRDSAIVTADINSNVSHAPHQEDILRPQSQPSQSSSSLSSSSTAPPPPPLLLPPKGAFEKWTDKTIRSKEIRGQIARLSVHPTLEAGLHILNLDLPSAHFLVRHMQCPPAWEGMYVHGILHRIEGDYDNARIWYGRVEGSDVMDFVWGVRRPHHHHHHHHHHSHGGGGGGEVPGEERKTTLHPAQELIDDVQHFKKTGEGDSIELGERSLDEIRAVMSFCVKKFGVGKISDASDVWTKNEGEVGEKGRAMVVGGEGWREF